MEVKGYEQGILDAHTRVCEQPDKEKLIRLMQEGWDIWKMRGSGSLLEITADHMIANGVTISGQEEK